MNRVAILLHDHLIKWSNIITGVELTPDEIRTIMDQSGKYSRVDKFRDRLLDPALKAINEQSSILVRYDRVKEQNNILAFHFFVCDRVETGRVLEPVKVEALEPVKVEALEPVKVEALEPVKVDCAASLTDGSSKTFTATLDKGPEIPKIFMDGVFHYADTIDGRLLACEDALVGWELLSSGVGKPKAWDCGMAKIAAFVDCSGFPDHIADGLNGKISIKERMAQLMVMAIGTKIQDRWGREYPSSREGVYFRALVILAHMAGGKIEFDSVKAKEAQTMYDNHQLLITGGGVVMSAISDDVRVML